MPNFSYGLIQNIHPRLVHLLLTSSLCPRYNRREVTELKINILKIFPEVYVLCLNRITQEYASSLQKFQASGIGETSVPTKRKLSPVI